MIDVNIRGVLHGISAVLPLMHAQGGGHVVNVASVGAYEVVPTSAVYSATKFAVTGMAEAARQDFNGTGVRTTLISPGMVETPGFSHDLDATLSSDDIARAVLFAVAQPPHMDVNDILIRPTAQESCETRARAFWWMLASLEGCGWP